MADKCSQKDHLKFGDCGGTINCNLAYTKHILRSAKFSAPYLLTQSIICEKDVLPRLPQNILTVYDIFISL